MASRVNVKFVTILSVVLLALMGGVVFTFYALMVKSASDHERAGDEAMKKGEYTIAQVHYSKAVDKEKSNTRYVAKWRDAIEHLNPEQEVAYMDMLQRLFGAMRQAARIDPGNRQAHRDYMESRRQTMLSGGFNRRAVESMIEEADSLVLAIEPTNPVEADLVRKYRGMARVALLAGTPDAPESLWGEARADLEAALKADPADSETAVILENFVWAQVGRAEERGDADAAARLKEEAKAIIPTFLAANPNDPTILFASLRRDLAEAIRAYRQEVKDAEGTGRTARDAAAVGLAFATENKPRLDAAFAAVAALDPARITIDLLQTCKTMEQSLDPASMHAKTAEIVKRVCEARPQDADLAAFRSELFASRDQFDEAVKEVQRILDLPQPPVSLAGAKLFESKRQARFFQAMWAARAALRQTDPALQPAAVAAARGYREKLFATVAADAKELQMVDAWLAYLEGDIEKADRLLDNLERSGRSMDIDSMLLWAQVAVRRQQPGAATDRLEAAIRSQPQNVNALMVLGDLKFSLKEFPAALKAYEEAARLMPSRTDIQDRLALARAAADPSGDVRNVQDPVVRVIIEADRIATANLSSADVDGKVAAFLETKIAELNYDPRLAKPLAMVYRRSGQHEKAIQVINQSLAKFPNDAALKALAQVLGETDDYAMRRRLVELSTDSDLDKAIQLYSLARESEGKAEDGAAAIAAMRRLAPDDPRVVEIVFLEAVMNKNWATAEEQVAKAARANADHVEGRTFKARLEAAKGDFKAAADTMQQVIDTGGAQPESFRLLGRFQMTLGRNDDAVQSFRRALELRPNDVEGIKDLIGGLTLVNRSNEALLVAREGRQYAEADRQFIDLWLGLEQQVGDARAALERREILAKARPTDRSNLLSLGQIYLKTNDIAKARDMVARVKALGDDLETRSFEAAVLWTSPESRPAAKALLTDYAEAQKENSEKLGALLVTAKFLYARQDVAGAIEVLERARPYQDPKVLEADKSLADVLFEVNALEQSIEPIRRVLAAGADNAQSLFRKRLVETFMRMGRWSEAEAALQPLLQTASPDTVAILLEADIRGGMGDTAGQQKALENAVAKFPKDPSVFLKRGQFLARSDATLRDAIADYSTAVQLAPRMWQPYRLRAEAYAKMRGSDGEPSQLDRVIDDLKMVIALRPDDDETLVGLVSDLVRLGRDQEAQRAVDDSLKNRPRDPDTYVKVGNLFMAAKRPRIAEGYFMQAYQLNPVDNIAQRRLDALLTPDAINLDEAMKFFAVLGQERISKNPGFLMAQAKAYLTMKRLPEANTVIVAALKLLSPDNPSHMIAWDTEMRSIQPDKAKHILFLDQAILNNVVPPVNDWLSFFKAMLLTGDAASASEGIELLRRVASSGKSDLVRTFAFQNLGGVLYGQSRVQEAEAAWREGLAAFPDDAELNNNLAYVLAAKLGKPAEAIPFATKALEKAPRSAEVLDTYGVVMLRNNRPADAIDKLDQAVGLARNPQTYVSAINHAVEAIIALYPSVSAVEERQRLFRRAEDHLMFADQSVAAYADRIDEDTKKQALEMRAQLNKLPKP